MMALRAKVQITRVARGRVVLEDARPAALSAPPEARIPRVARLMALAIRFDRLLREGRVRSLTELARLAKVTQPRATQIMNLTLLAPDIQEALLSLPGTAVGRDRINERSLRPIAALAEWRRQRREWAAISAASRSDRH